MFECAPNNRRKSPYHCTYSLRLAFHSRLYTCGLQTAIKAVHPLKCSPWSAMRACIPREAGLLGNEEGYLNLLIPPRVAAENKRMTTMHRRATHPTLSSAFSSRICAALSRAPLYIPLRRTHFFSLIKTDHELQYNIRACTCPWSGGVSQASSSPNCYTLSPFPSSASVKWKV